MLSIWHDTQKTVSGFISAGLFDRQGLLVDGFSANPEFHIEHAAATFLTLIQEADSAGEFIGLGSAQEVQLTYNNSFILLRTIPKSSMIIGLASAKNAPLGKVRMAMDILVNKLEIAGKSMRG